MPIPHCSLFAEARLLRRSREEERNDALEEFAGTEKKKGSVENRLGTVRDVAKKTEAGLIDAYTATRERLEQGRNWWNTGRRQKSIDKRVQVEKAEAKADLRKQISSAAVDQVEKAGTSGSEKLGTLKNAAMSKVLEQAHNASRRLQLCTAEEEICTKVIAQLEAEVSKLNAEAQLYTGLAEMLEKDVKLDEVVIREEMQSAADELLEEIRAEKVRLEEKELPEDAPQRADQFLRTLESIGLTQDGTALFGLEDALYEAVGNGNAASLIAKIDGLKVSKSQKDLLKDAANGLTKNGVRQVAAATLSTRIRSRVESAKNANAKEPVGERITELQKVSVGQKMRMKLNGTTRDFVVAATKFKGHFIILQGSDGKYASIDTRDDGGNYFVTYTPSGSKKTKSIALNASQPAPKKTDDASTVLLETQRDPIPVSTIVPTNPGTP